jgi:hypothetical protein
MEPSGGWDSIHVFETMERGRQAHYKLTSTIMLQLVTRRGSADGSPDAKEPAAAAWKHDGEISLSGSMTRQVCVSQTYCPSHDVCACVVGRGVIHFSRCDRWSKIIPCRIRRRTCRMSGGWSRIWRSRCGTCCRRCTLARRAMWCTISEVWTILKKRGGSGSSRGSWWASSSGDLIVQLASWVNN